MPSSISNMRKKIKKSVAKSSRDLVRDESKAKEQDNKLAESKIDEKKSDSMPSEINFLPNVIMIPEVDDIMGYNVNPSFGMFTSPPQFKLGYQHFYSQSKNKTEILNKLKQQGRMFFYVTNPFEHRVDEYANDIEHDTYSYFNLNNKYQIASRGFYKMWEMIMAFDLISNTSSNFVSAHLAECPGGFIQASVLYRQTFAENKNRNNSYYCIGIHDETRKFSSTFQNYMDKTHKGQLHIHPTYPITEVKNSDNKDNGDLREEKARNHFVKNFVKTKADLVSADAGFDFVDEILQEQESYLLILAQILTALRIQKEGGTFVCKIFEMFTPITIKILCILKHFYSKISIYKPLLSRTSNSERYIICKGFKFDLTKNKKEQKLVDEIEKLVKQIKNNPGKLNNIFPEYSIPSKLTSLITIMNLHIANEQFKAINDMLVYINSNNYHGEDYYYYRGLQINASKFWLDLFYPKEAREFANNKSKFQNILAKIMESNSEESKELRKKLIK